MKTFCDTAGRRWRLTIDVNAIKRVMKARIEHLGEPLKVNLLELVEPDSQLLKKVVEYPPLLCDIVYALCRPQCDEQGVSDEEFGRAMTGEALETALDCILEEAVDFFPPIRRAALKKVLQKSRDFAEKAKTIIKSRLDAGELEAALDAIMEPELRKLAPPPTNGTGSAGNWPASAASIPVVEPSAS